MARRLRRLATRAYHVGRAAAGGMKDPAIAGGVGAGAAVLEDYFLKDVGFIQDNWWARGALFLASGYLIRRKVTGWGTPAGYSLLGIGGYVLARAYMDNNASNAKGVDAGAVWGRRRMVDAGQVVNDVFGSGNAAGLDPASAAYANYAE